MAEARHTEGIPDADPERTEQLYQSELVKAVQSGEEIAVEAASGIKAGVSLLRACTLSSAFSHEVDLRREHARAVSRWLYRDESGHDSPGNSSI